ncbi:hypothetical protein FKM82_031205, partial [Ascaphus truei]
QVLELYRLVALGLSLWTQLAVPMLFLVFWLVMFSLQMYSFLFSRPGILGQQGLIFIFLNRYPPPTQVPISARIFIFLNRYLPPTQVPISARIFMFLNRYLPPTQVPISARIFMFLNRYIPPTQVQISATISQQALGCGSHTSVAGIVHVAQTSDWDLSKALLGHIYQASETGEFTQILCKWCHFGV